MAYEVGWFTVGAVALLAILVLAWPESRRWLTLLAEPAPRRASVGIVGMMAAGFLATAMTHHGRPAETFYSPLAATPTPALSGNELTVASRMSGSPAALTGNSASLPKVPSMEVSTSKLAARLEKGGGTKADWRLLGQSYEFLGRKEQAAKAFAKAESMPQ